MMTFSQALRVATWETAVALSSVVRRSMSFTSTVGGAIKALVVGSTT